jgi:hypothetical protein
MTIIAHTRPSGTDQWIHVGGSGKQRPAKTEF